MVTKNKYIYGTNVIFFLICLIDRLIDKNIMNFKNVNSKYFLCPNGQCFWHITCPDQDKAVAGDK